MDDLTNIKQKRKYIVGAYATSPNLYKWDEESEKQYFDALKKLSSIGGLEIPFWGESLHPFDDEWFMKNIDPSWENVLTCVPGTMKALGNGSNVGLASRSSKGIKKAFKLYQKAQNAIRQLNDYIGRNVIKAVHITSAPGNMKNKVNGSGEAFRDSLAEISSWDWCGAKVVVEHCDAYCPGLKPQKGFLSLDDEINAILSINEKSNTNVGVTINWGRSVIEKRSVDGAVEHIKASSRAGILSGIMFSGVTDKIDSPYGPWKDLHMPPPKAYDMEFYAENSLMTFQNMEATLLACDMDMIEYIGIKLLAMPENTSIERRVGLNRDAMKLLDRIISNSHGVNVGVARANI